MTELRDMALMLDEREDTAGCVAAYEALIAAAGFEVIDLLELALVYFRVFDSGSVSERLIPIDIQLRSATRCLELLDEAVQRDPQNCEARFWSIYCRSVITVWDEEGLNALVGTPSAECSGAFATMWRIMRGNRAEVSAAQSILADPSTRKTSKGRFIASII